jgi:apolipoprotein N-acyltransferase
MQMAKAVSLPARIKPFADARWFRPAAALACGLFAATGFVPLGWWPLALAALAGLMALGFTAPNAAKAFRTGWLFGLGHFTLGLNWIATAFTYQAAMPVWLGWVGVVLLSGFLAIFTGLIVLTAWATAVHGRDRLSPAAFLFAFAALWIGGEFLRATIFTGFAWNPLAAIALGGFGRPGLAVTAQFLGTYALSGLVVLLAGCWWLAVRQYRQPLVAGVLALLPVAMMLGPWPVVGQRAGTLPFRLVQPDIRQEVLNEPQWYERHFVKTIQLSGVEPDDESTRLVIWPESGVPDYLREGYPERYYRQATFAADPAIARARISTLLGPGALLLTGTIDLVIPLGGNRATGAENVVTAIGPDGEIAGGYAKAHLVPFGEYLPLRPLLEPVGLTRLVPGTLDFRAGPGPRTLDLGRWGKAGIQICYEIVFSGEVVDPNHRPDYIMNPSNDGWFGAWGPPQHLAQARLRAIEEGIPVLRSTTTGISAVIDAGGVVRAHVPRHTAAAIEGKVPPALVPTPFARWGLALSLGWGVLLFGIAIVALRRRGV